MPHAINRDVKIYYEVEGSGPPLMLAHGLGYSGEDWRDFGYAELLKPWFQLILVDHRGHGKSDKPHDAEAYRPELRVMDHVVVLDDLGISTAHFWGYSLGGALGYAIGATAPDRFRSLIIGGEDPYPPPDAPGGDPPVGDAVLELLQQGGQAWVKHREAEMVLTPAMRARYRLNDFVALQALRRSPRRWRHEIVALLPDFPIPCLLYGGEAEEVYPAMKTAVLAMPDATFVSLPGSHVDISGSGAARWCRTSGAS
jgi:pimeloyl-ACP methyl ester carboxylesterase